MIIDGYLLFDGTGQGTPAGLTGVNQFATNTSTTSTNILDLLNFRDIGAAADLGPALTVEWVVTTAYAGGTSVNFQIQGSQSSSGSWVTYAETGAIPVESLTAGARVKLPMPPVNPETGEAPRYLQLSYVSEGTFTAGAVIAWLGTVENPRYYPPGVTVSN